MSEDVKIALISWNRDAKPDGRTDRINRPIKSINRRYTIERVFLFKNESCHRMMCVCLWISGYFSFLTQRRSFHSHSGGNQTKMKNLTGYPTKPALVVVDINNFHLLSPFFIHFVPTKENTGTKQTTTKSRNRKSNIHTHTHWMMISVSLSIHAKQISTFIIFFFSLYFQIIWWWWSSPTHTHRSYRQICMIEKWMNEWKNWNHSRSTEFCSFVLVWCMQRIFYFQKNLKKNKILQFFRWKVVTPKEYFGIIFSFPFYFDQFCCFFSFHFHNVNVQMMMMMMIVDFVTTTEIKWPCPC